MLKQRPFTFSYIADTRKSLAREGGGSHLNDNMRTINKNTNGYTPNI